MSNEEQTNKDVEIEDLPIENFDVSVRVIRLEESADDLPAGTMEISVKFFRQNPFRTSLKCVSATSRVYPHELSGFYSDHPTKIQAITNEIAILFSDLAGDPTVVAQSSTYRPSAKH